MDIYQIKKFKLVLVIYSTVGGAILRKKERPKKVVFEDAGVNKIAYGTVEDLGDFLVVKDKVRGTITVNKRFVVFIKED